jgi:prolyl-tRNA synthetase
MRLSQFYLPLLKETPSEAQIASHRLMLRAGMVRQLSAGMYNWLPLGLKVLKKVENIVREEMDKAGFNELLMPTLQPAELWEESGRYDSYGKEMLRMTDRHERRMLYGPTNEEVITDLFRQTIRSYKDMPLRAYHIQWKFRDEIRPRFGVMRGREFLMKDAYSFDASKEAAIESYNLMYVTYLNIFARMGLVAVPVRADTGPIGGDLSHEFQVVAETGESTIYYDAGFDELRDGKIKLSVDEMKKLYAAADEQHVADKCPIGADRLREARGIEVGHIFYLGTKYSEALKANVMNHEGKEIPAEMGCYGVGVSRLVGALIEANHDANGIIWPESVSPFAAGIVNLKPGDAGCDAAAQSLYDAMRAAGKEPLLDDTDNRAGAKFAGMELIGLPWMVTIGPKGVEAGTVDLKNRRTGEQQTISLEAAKAQLTQNAKLARVA